MHGTTNLKSHVTASRLEVLLHNSCYSSPTAMRVAHSQILHVEQCVLSWCLLFVALVPTALCLAQSAFTATSLTRYTIFWDCLTLNVKTPWSFEVSVPVYRSTARNTPEGLHYLQCTLICEHFNTSRHIIRLN